MSTHRSTNLLEVSVVILIIGCTIDLSIASGCWWTGCQLRSWAVVGCGQYDMIEVDTKTCDGGKEYQCCPKVTVKASANEPTSNCWWTGCQLTSWAVVGCDQYDRDTKGTKSCDGGKEYECCSRNSSDTTTTDKPNSSTTLGVESNLSNGTQTLTNSSETVNASDSVESCWWTGCQLRSWAVVGCGQYDRDEKATKDCEGGKEYECCPRNSKQVPATDNNRSLTGYSNAPSLPEEPFDYKIVCYFTNWAWSRPSGSEYTPEDTEAKYCTHINYGFASLDSSSLTIKSGDTVTDFDNHFMKRVVDLKKQNPKLKVLLSLGGWSDSSDDKYSRLVASPSARSNFIDQSIQFLTQYEFDGLDIDWEYPKCWQTSCEKGPESDKSNFATFIHELRQSFNPKGLLLTAAVSPSKRVIDAGYDVLSLASDFDFINIMAYDMHGMWEKFASHHAPLDARTESSSFDPNDATLNIKFVVNYYISNGMPARKIILGVPFYGQSFTLKEPAESHPFKGFGAAALKGGDPGPITRSPGTLSFVEICENIKSEGWTKARDPSSGLSFAYKGTQWVGYDDQEVMKRKSELIKSLGIGGAMIWTLDYDDFKGRCCSTKWPLLKTLNSVLLNETFLEEIEC